MVYIFFLNECNVLFKSVNIFLGGGGGGGGGGNVLFDILDSCLLYSPPLCCGT